MPSSLPSELPPIDTPVWEAVIPVGKHWSRGRCQVVGPVT